ncbi:MAG TPA: hypothetical protein DHW82_01405, partial [Spirochaetia bacterium]|nr:hypothetical protein [Spirochaetia bacterium]
MKKFILICLLNIITSNFLFSKTYQIEFETLIERGSLIYPDLKRKQFELSNVILQKEEVDYRRLPSISGGLGFSYVPYIYRDGGTIKIDSSFPADWSIVLAPSLSVTLPIYTFGKIPNGEKAALYQVELKKAELEETDSNVRYQMKQVFWGYLLAKIMIDKILKDVLKQYDKFVSEKETDFSQGKTTRASLESTKIAYYDYQRHESDAYLSLNQTYYLIRAIYGASKEDTVETPYKRLLPVELSIKPFEDYLELSKNFNYSFKKAHFGYLARKYYYEYQKATYWPDIGLLFSTSYVYRKQDKMFEENGSYIPKTTLLPEIGWTISLGFGMNFDFT